MSVRTRRRSTVSNDWPEGTLGRQMADVQRAWRAFVAAVLNEWRSLLAVGVGVWLLIVAGWVLSWLWPGAP